MEKLTDRVRIHGLLKRLLESRSLLTVNLKGNPEDFTTAIIKISSDGNVIYLDELKPEHGHPELVASPLFRAKAYVDGVYLAFEGCVDSFDEQDGIPFYRVLTPTEADYHQRRNNVRITLSSGHPVPVQLCTEDNHTVVEGNVADLSLGGLRIRFHNDIPKHISPGDKFVCTLPLPPDNKEVFNCEFIVRAVNHTTDNLKQPFIGGQFIGISKAAERQIQKTVMLLQRSAQKKRNI